MVVNELSDALVSLQHVTKKYGNRTVLSNISLRIHRGESLIVMGGNGSGKSTLLRLVSGLIPVTSGERVVESPKLLLGYAPDRMPKLRMTSTEYLTYIGKIARIPKQQLQVRIEELHSMFNLEQSTNKMTQFSKGMLQKVNIMQATLRIPDLLVLDEPFSGLDKQSIAHLMHSLQAIQAQGASIVAAVHDPLLVSQLDSRTYWIRQGQLFSEQMNDALQPYTISFEIVCSVESGILSQLEREFPDVEFQPMDNDQVTMNIMQQDYSSFMLALLKNEIEIISLQRKEMCT